MKSNQVIIVHGWDGYPEEGWFPWLKTELEKKGFEVHVPQLPDPENPRIFNWVPKLAELVGVPDEQTYFVGHSMGCQAIARFIESLPVGVSVGGAVFVGGYFTRLTGLEDEPGVRETDQHWLSAPLDLSKVRSHLPKSIAIFSDDDPWVPLDNKDAFEKQLGSKIIIQHKRGHFSGSRDNCFQLPVALDAILEIAKN